MRTFRSRSWLVVALLVVAVAACGSSDGTAESEALQEELTDPAVFCDAAAEAQSLANGPAEGQPSNEFNDHAAGVMEDLETEAPAEVRDSIDTIVAAVRQNMSTSELADPSFTQEPEFVAADHEADAYMLEHCEAGSIEVSAKGHAFEGVPNLLRPGLTAFTLTNDDHHAHELKVLRINDGVTSTLEELVAFGPNGAKNFTFAGQATTPSHGNADTVFVNLQPGRYAVFCLVTDAPGQPPHVAQGMYAGFSVQPK